MNISGFNSTGFNSSYFSSLRQSIIYIKKVILSNYIKVKETISDYIRINTGIKG